MVTAVGSAGYVREDPAGASGRGPAFPAGWYGRVLHRGRSGAECVLALGCVGVEQLVFAGEVEAPVVVEVAVADDGAG